MSNTETKPADPHLSIQCFNEPHGAFVLGLVLNSLAQSPLPAGYRLELKVTAQETWVILNIEGATPQEVALMKELEAEVKTAFAEAKTVVEMAKAGATTVQ